MTLSTVMLPYQYFPNPTKGVPLAGGEVYVGEPDTDPTIVANQKQIVAVQESGTEVNLSQPVTLGAGGVPLYNGSPVRLSVAGNYSIAVLNSQGAQVYYNPNASETFNPVVPVSSFTESQTLASGQTSVTFANDIRDGQFFIVGPDADNGRLEPTDDYTVDLPTKTVTLTQSYPAGTVLMLGFLESVGTPLVDATYDTVALMNAASIEAGELVQTAGRATAGDDEGSIYYAETLADYGATPDEENDFSLANGNVARQLGRSYRKLIVGDRDVPPGANTVFIRDVIDDATDSATSVQVQRQANYNASTNPKAMRVLTTIASGVDSVEYAVSAELINNSDAVNGGASAASAVSIKNGVGNTFASHVQVKDTQGLISSLGGATIGQELNIQANGVDDGEVRIGHDIIARTYQPNFATAGAGEFYCAVRIRNSSLGAEGGKWINGLIIEDGVQTIPNAIKTKNSPGSGVGVGIEDTGTKARGIDLKGAYGTAALDLRNSDITSNDIQLRLKDRGKIEFISGVSLKWDSTVNGGSGSMVALGQSTQNTVGAAGVAVALPANPTGYLNLNLNGTDVVVPFYAAS